MYPIDGPGATTEHTFTEGDPATSTPATTVTADYLNMLQAELLNLITTGGGLTPDKDDNTQLMQAFLVMAQTVLVQDIPVNLSSGPDNIPILSANDPLSKEVFIFKLAADVSGNIGTIVPATGGLINHTGTISEPGEGVRLRPNKADNNWYFAG